MESSSFQRVLWFVLNQLQLALANSKVLAYLITLYSLAVVNGMPCMPSLSSLIHLLNSMGALLILMHVAIQVVGCH